jgi:2-methylcitrate dehydratase PrpD
MNDIIVKLAENVVSTRYEDLPAESVASAKKSVLDNIGAAIAGATDCRKEVELVREWGGKEESTILVYGDKVPAPNAAWVNTAMAQALDFDGQMASFHGGACIIPTALTASEISGKVNGKELITAIVLAEDLAMRITEACPRGSVNETNGGFNQAGIIVVFGTAALAARLLGLDLNGMVNALGFALTRASGSHQAAADKVSAVKLSCGLVSRSGIESAVLAQKGFSGIRNVLQGDFGFFALFSRGGYNADALTEGLGKSFPTGFRTKIRPHCGTTQPATEATLQLVHENDIDPEQVSHVIADVDPGVYPITGHPFNLVEGSPTEGHFHLAYTVANAIVRKGSRLEHFTEAAVRDPQVGALAHRVHVVSNQNIKEPLATHVAIFMKDGSKYSRYENRMPMISEIEDVRKKFRECAAFGSPSLAEANAEKIIATADRLEELDDVSELIKLAVENQPRP